MAKSTKNNFTMANINKLHKDLTAQLDVTIYSPQVKGGLDLKVDKYLTKSKIMDMIAEVMAQVQVANKEDINLHQFMMPFSILMLLKHFTSYGKEIPSELKKQIVVAKKLVDLDLLQPILEIFPEEEMTEVFNVIAKTIEETNDKVVEISERVKAIEEAFEKGLIEDVIELGAGDEIEIIEEEGEVNE